MRYIAEISFKGLTEETKQIGTYVISEKTINKIAYHFPYDFNIDLIEETEKNPIGYDKLLHKINEVAYKIGLVKNNMGK